MRLNNLLNAIFKGMLMILAIVFFVIAAIKFSNSDPGAGLFLLVSFLAGVAYIIVKDE